MCAALTTCDSNIQLWCSHTMGVNRLLLRRPITPEAGAATAAALLALLTSDSLELEYPHGYCTTIWQVVNVVFTGDLRCEE